MRIQCALLRAVNSACGLRRRNHRGALWTGDELVGGKDDDRLAGAIGADPIALACHQSDVIAIGRIEIRDEVLAIGSGEDEQVSAPTAAQRVVAPVTRQPISAKLAEQPVGDLNTLNADAVGETIST